MRIVLVGEVLRFRSFNGANKALPVLASSLHNGGFPDVVQMDLERPDISIQDVCREAVNSDLVAFAGCMTPQWPELDASTVRVYDALLQSGRRHVPIIVGGYAAKGIEDVARASPWISAFFDGEGEEAMPRIAEAVASGHFAAKREAIPGLCHLDGSGVFRRSTAARVANFDAIDQGYGFVHIPGVHDMDIFRGADGRQLKTAQLFTQRGCPWNCGYCNKSTEGNTVARLKTDSLRAQLAKLRQQGFEAIYLDVDTFVVNRSAAKAEADLLGEYGFVWGSNTRIDQIDAELMRHFVEKGCAYMFFGVEHIHPGVTVAIGKFNGNLATQIQNSQAYPSRVAAVFSQMRLAGLPSSYFIILGLPKAVLSDTGIAGFAPTTFEDDVAAVRFGLENCDPDYLNLNVLRFMPGSVAADAWFHPAYSCVRPSGESPVTAGYFLPRVGDARRYRVSVNHPVYRLCESVAMNQPTTTALDPQRVYDTVSVAMEIINARIARGMRPTRLFIEQELLEAGLVERTREGSYFLAPFREWESYGGKPSPSQHSSVRSAFERVASAGPVLQPAP